MALITNLTRRQSRWSGVNESAPWLICGVGLAIILIPLVADLAKGEGDVGNQASSELMLLFSALLLWRNWAGIYRRPLLSEGSLAWASVFMLIGGLAFVYGRVLLIPTLEVFSIAPIVAGIIVLLRGPRRLAGVWVPLVLLILAVPLPISIMTAITQPMQLLVSSTVEGLLYAFGLPISRSGIILQLAQYRLLVAEACAGLNTIFALEALSLLYINFVHNTSVARNIIVAIAVIPISLVANAIRVLVLCLVTLYFGDAAGQGFLHSFSGILLFMTAVLLLLLLDSALGQVSTRLGRKGHAC